MRVLHLLKTSVGASWALRQIRELVQLGVEVHVTLPDGGSLVGRYAGVGATEHILQADLPIRKFWNFQSLTKSFRELVGKVNPDIIHSHFVGTTLTMRLALCRNFTIPRVFQVPGPLHLEHKYFRKAEILSASSKDYWCGSCVRTCQYYRDAGISDDKIFLAYYGTDLGMFRSSEKGRLRREIGADGRTRIVGMVSYMYAPKNYLGQKRGLKGHEDLIDAFAICVSHSPDMRCVFVGGAWAGAYEYEKEVRSYARQRCGEKVVFLGTRNDVPSLYTDFDVAVHPSHTENVGGAVESLLFGVPTIATRVGGFTDLVKEGETGWLVPPRSPQLLAEKIMEALDNREEALSRAKKGQILASQMFDVLKTSRDVLRMYEKILNLGRNG